MPALRDDPIKYSMFLRCPTRLISGSSYRSTTFPASARRALIARRLLMLRQLWGAGMTGGSGFEAPLARGDQVSSPGCADCETRICQMCLQTSSIFFYLQTIDIRPWPECVLLCDIFGRAHVHLGFGTQHRLACGTWPKTIVCAFAWL